MKKNYKLGAFAYTATLFAVPLMVGAQSFLDAVPNLIQRISVILMGVAVLVFLWGVLQYVVAKDADKQKEARGVIIYGIVALFVMVSVWGLVNILVGIFQLDNGTVPNPPIIPGS